ncbi:nuclear transport factor 2 family protein [Oceanobacillus jeddahense]|uniref:nuclear transport factor 2 family protein n=1 Tax=Oceanobacillus jeddahense TaxID=1462527 RepID=UPI000595F07F|nr:nuclear transport factor 2 family protein [Oceanobacillus jeddahense]
MKSISNLVRQYFSAYETKNRTMLEGLLSTNFHFTSPVDNSINKEAYMQRCWPSCKHIDTYEIQNLLVDGNKAVIRYECRLISGVNFRNMEYFNVVGNKIEEIDVYFGYDLRNDLFEGEK